MKLNSDPAARRAEGPLLTREMAVAAVNDEARTFDVVWSTGAPVTRRDWWRGGTFTETLDLSAEAVRLGRLNSGDAPLLESHETWSTDARIGVVVAGSVSVNGSEGRATVRMLSAGIDPRADKIFAKVKDGILRSVSVGYVVHTWEETHKDDVLVSRVAKDWEPYEISLVAIPADPQAGVRSDTRNFACIIRAVPAHQEVDMTKTVADPAAPNAPETTTDPKDKRSLETPKPEVTAQERAGAFAYIGRAFKQDATAILAAMGAHDDAEAWRDTLIDARAVEDERSHISNLGVSITRDAGETMLAGMEQALAHRAGVKDVKLDVGLAYRGMSLFDLGREWLEAHGHRVRGLKRDEMIGLMLRSSGPGFHGTGDFINVLGNTAQRTLRAAYDAVPQTFGGWARKTTLPDFKPSTVVALSGAPSLEEINEHGEFTYGTMSDASETIQLKEYGRMFALTRQIIINDDLGAFTRIPELWGQAAANKESDLVYGVLLNNPVMKDGNQLFSVAHANVGTTGVPSDTTLTEAFQKIEAQKGLDGQAITVKPKYIMTGSALRQTVQRLLTAVTATKTSDTNIWQNALEHIVEPRITGSKWFIAADPATIDTVVYAHLAGQEGVYTEQKDGWSVSGVEYKARLDFGAAAGDFRGLFYNQGA